MANLNHFRLDMLNTRSYIGLLHFDIWMPEVESLALSYLETTIPIWEDWAQNNLPEHKDFLKNEMEYVRSGGKRSLLTKQSVIVAISSLLEPTQSKPVRLEYRSAACIFNAISCAVNGHWPASCLTYTAGAIVMGKDPDQPTESYTQAINAELEKMETVILNHLNEIPRTAELSPVAFIPPNSIKEKQ